jgi:prepilin-type processing-associated H-X9-DG protein
LRSILQATHIFAAQNNGMLPGSVYSSSRFLFVDPYLANNPASNIAGYSNTNCPTIVSVNDWASPIAKIMNVKYNEGPDPDSRAQRFVQLRDLKQFTCPSGDTPAIQYGGTLSPSDPVLKGQIDNGRLMSYTVALPFLLQRDNGKPLGSGGGTWGVSVSRGASFNAPAGYNCKISKVGDPARKVFIADGARYANHTDGPDYDLSFNGTFGGPFCDQGPGLNSNAWNRTAAKGNANSTPTAKDARMYWARHSGSQAFKYSKGGSFRFNVGFFDGHVETLDDLAGADPKLWHPKGSIVLVTGQFDADVMAKYFPGGIPAPQPGVPAGWAPIP